MTPRTNGRKPGKGPGDPTRRGAVLILGASVAAGLLSARSRTAAGTALLSAGASLAYAGLLAVRASRAMRLAKSAGTGGDWRPFVTVVVPAKDEAPVIADLVRDLAVQDYSVDGAPGYEAIVVDDASSDGTGDLARAAAEGSGGRVRVVRREPGVGPATRGAVLNFALAEARGSVLGALDADSRVDRDFIARTIGAWNADADAAGLQVLKRPTNPDRSWLTRAQAEELIIDMTSQCGRWLVGGTAELRGNGMFVKRDALERVGGWGDEALTEDLDMSIRLAAAGERVAPAPGVAVREQALEEVRPLWHQRMRWAEGSLRRFISHGGAVFRSPIPMARKIDEAAFMATESGIPPFLAAAVAGQLLSPAGRRTGWRVPLALTASYYGVLVLFGGAGLHADGRRGRELVVGSLRGSAFLAHWLLVVPAALVKIAMRPAKIRYVKTPRIASRAPVPQAAGGTAAAAMVAGGDATG